MPAQTLDLLDYTLARHAPSSIILERDDRLDATGEILDDVARIRALVNRRSSDHDAEAAAGTTG